jgi:hypothetical protein
VAVAVWLSESVTCTVKFAVPVVAGVPERTPAVDRLRLSGVKVPPPEVTIQVE